MKEVVSSLEVIINFFDSGFPNEHRKDLKKWRRHVINDKQFNSRNGSGYLVSVYDENIHLLEAAHTLMISKPDTISLDKKQEDYPKTKMTDWAFYPKNLSHKEISNPYLAIRKVFKKITIVEYKKHLHNWLRIAVSNKSARETLTTKEIIDVYDNLKKLYSAVWIIHQTECQ